MTHQPANQPGKRLHVHVTVPDLDAGKRFYAALFGSPPTVDKADYVKWMLDDPRVNFAISNRGSQPGVDHLGIQVDAAEALTALRDQAEQAGVAAVAQTGAACCYTRSDKYWLQDPAGVAWETFHSLEAIPTFNEPTQETAGETADAACCAPKPTEAAACCAPAAS